MASLIHGELSRKVLGAAFAVHNALGPGSLESAYEGALCVELKHLGLGIERQVVYPLEYRGEYVGAYIADLVVEGTVIVELKSVKALTPVMEAQIVNYLGPSGLPVRYLLNVAGTRVEWNRLVYWGYWLMECTRYEVASAPCLVSAETSGYSTSAHRRGWNITIRAVD